MTDLTTMYVYFDILGDIKTISPNNTHEINLCKFAAFPLQDVEQFLTGKLNPHDFNVVKDAKSDVYKLIRKKSTELDLKRKLDSYITEVENKTKNVSIFIENNIALKCIIISINPTLIELLNNETDENDLGIRDFFTKTHEFLFFTKKHDPYFLLFSVNFSPADLLKAGSVCINYECNLEESSLYTMKTIDGYSYTIKDM